MANDMKKELRKVNEAIEYLAKLQDSYSDKTFGLDKLKKGTKEYKIALRQQSAAKDQALKTWANWNGSNKFLEVLHDKDIGKISHGGALGKGRAGSIKDWTWGQQNFTLNSDGSRYQTGHVAGMLSPSAALEELRSDQAWVVSALGAGRITKDMYKNMPYAVRHLSGSRSIEKQFGSIGDPVIPNPLQIGNQGWRIGPGGMVNPFYDAEFVKYDYDTEPSTKTVRGFLGIGQRTIRTKGTIDYNLPDYKFFTNHFGDSKYKGVGADSNDGTAASINKTREYNNRGSLGLYQGSTYDVTGGGGWHGRGANILTSDGNLTSLSINQLDRNWHGVAPGETLGVMTKGQRNRYKLALEKAGGPSYATE